MFLKHKTLNRRFFNAVGSADFTAQNCTGDKIVLKKQVFVAFNKNKEISLSGSYKKCLIFLDHVSAAILNL